MNRFYLIKFFILSDKTYCILLFFRIKICKFANDNKQNINYNTHLFCYQVQKITLSIHF